jgi:Flp pilus assembly CpaF family ATPase
LFLFWICSTLWTGHHGCVTTVRAAAAEETAPQRLLSLSVTEQRKQEYISLAIANYPPITVC